MKTSRCADCDGEATAQCDDCGRWLCATHLVIEAQAWDVGGWDGVDFRCHAHRRITWDTRDLVHGCYLPHQQGAGDAHP